MKRREMAKSEANVKIVREILSQTENLRLRWKKRNGLTKEKRYYNMTNRWRGRINSSGERERTTLGCGKKVTETNKRQEKTRELCEPCYPLFKSHLFTYPSSSWSIITLSCICLVTVHGRNTKGAEKRQSERYKRPSVAGGPEARRWFHSEPLTEGKTSFSGSRLVSSNTNRSVYQKFWICSLSIFLLLLLLFRFCFFLFYNRPSVHIRVPWMKCFPASSQGE